MTARKRLRDYEQDGAGPSTSKKVVFRFLLYQLRVSAPFLFAMNSDSSKVCYDSSVALALMDPAPISCELPPPERRDRQITMEEAKSGTTGTELVPFPQTEGTPCSIIASSFWCLCSMK